MKPLLCFYLVFVFVGDETAVVDDMSKNQIIVTEAQTSLQLISKRHFYH